MRIAILGSGGVGGYFGGRLAATGTPGMDITFIARGAHLEAMRAHGLRILSPAGDVHVPRVNATDDPAAIGPVDVVFFTVKLYDTDAATKMLPPLLGPRTLVVPFQNGVDSVDTLVRAVGRDHVAGGTAYVAAVIAEPGVIRHTAMGRLIFGAIDTIDGSHPAVLEELLQACALAGFDAKLSDRIMADIWAKFVRLTVFSGMTAITRSPIGVVCGDPDLFAMTEAALRESIAVARGKQIPLPQNLHDEVLASLRALPSHAKSSMLEDLERGRRIEVPWLSGAMVRIGREVEVNTPTHRLIATLLAPHINGHPPAQ